jgi:hypothetical protein
MQMTLKALASTLYGQATEPLSDDTTSLTASTKKKRKRAKKTSVVPTRIYSYRCLAPITEADRVENQYRLASQYRNALVEIERWLRAEFRKIWLADETVAPALILYDDAQAGVDDAYDDLRAAKSGVAEPDLTAPLAWLAITKELRDFAGDQLREARALATTRLREIERADPIVGPLRVRYEEAQAVRKAAKSASATERERLDDLKQLAHDAWVEARRVAEDEGRLPRDLFRLAREEAEVRNRATRTDYRGRGVRQGVYTRIEASVKQAAQSTKRPLHFEAYDKSGAIGEQITDRQSRKSKSGDEPTRESTYGLTISELMSQVDTRLRLGPPGSTDAHPRAEVTACATWDEAMRLPRNLRRHAARTWIDLRVGTNPDRTPIFARFPVTLHRLPPKDSVIKWAYVVRRRIGHQLEWRFQITIESKTFDKPPIAIGHGACAVNLGWRRLVDDQGEAFGLRAAYVVDQEGREREIRVPDYVAPRRTGKSRPRPVEKQVFPVLGAIGKCDDLAHIRDQTLDRIKPLLTAWLTERGGVPTEWDVVPPKRPDGSTPKSISERLDDYTKWRAMWKLRRFVDLWKTCRVPGDEQIFEALMAWAKQDRHLETWQAHVRDKVIARRLDTWRVVAAQLAREYATIIVWKGKLTQIDGWEQPEPEDGGPSDGRLQRRMSRIAAPGELLAEIIKAAAKTGAEVRLREAVNATQECAACGCNEPWDAKPLIMHQCERCSETWDQDANHCRNLLKREGLIDSGGPRMDGQVPASHNMESAQRNSGSAVSAMLAKMPK